MAETVELGSQCFATLQTPSENFLISCGNWDNSFQVVSLSDGKVVQSIRRHKDVVSSVAGIYHAHFVSRLCNFFLFCVCLCVCVGWLGEETSVEILGGSENREEIL